MFHLVIDGRPAECRDGATILDALRASGVGVPTLCHDSRLESYGGCRLCIVEVGGWRKPVTACTTPAADGMRIDTHTPELETLRRSLLKLIANDYPEEAYRRDPGKEFHRYIHEYGLEQELNGRVDPALLDDAHPYIRVDMSQCVYCFRCVRICDEVQ